MTRWQLSESTGVPDTTIRRTSEKMILIQQLNQQISSTNSLFTITNWDKYQEVNQQTASNRPAGEPTNGQQTATLKELKKERIKEKAVSSVADPRRDEFIKLFFDGYKKEFRVPYVFTKADGHNLKYFLKNNPDITIDRMLNSLSGCISNEFDKKNLSIKYVLSNFSKLERLYVPNN